MKANMNIKVDTEVRDEARALFNQMGLDMTTAVNMFLIATIREKGIPFAVTTRSLSTGEITPEAVAKKLRSAERQEAEGKMRSLSDFDAEITDKYGL